MSDAVRLPGATAYIKCHPCFPIYHQGTNGDAHIDLVAPSTAGHCCATAFNRAAIAVYGGRQANTTACGFDKADVSAEAFSGADFAVHIGTHCTASL